MWPAVLLALALGLRLATTTTTTTTTTSTAKAVTLQLRANPAPDIRLTKRDYIASSFRSDSQAASYFVDVLVGTPPQFFPLALSSGSTTWVPSPRDTDSRRFCANRATGNEFWSCFYPNFFEPNKSTTFVPYANSRFDRTYGSSRIFAKGSWGSDVFQINQLTIANVSFGLATNWTTGGKLGLGVGLDRSVDSYPTIPEVMAADNAINLVLYSLYVNDIRNDGGGIYFGAVDQSKYTGSLRSYDSLEVGQVPVTGVYWISASGTNTSLTGEQVRSDDVGELQLGTPSLWLPNNVFTALVNLIPGLTYQQSYEAYTMQCGADLNLGVLQFDLDGMLISIGLRQILLEYPPGSGLCVFLAYQNSYSGPKYLLGTPFLRSAFSVFDYTNNQTSIAPSVANSTSSSVREVPAAGVRALPQSGQSGDVASPSPTTALDPSPSATSIAASTKPNVAAIAGGTVGGIVAIAIIASLAWFFIRRRNQQQQQQAPDMPLPAPAERGDPFPYSQDAISPIATTQPSAPHYNFTQPQYKPPEMTTTNITAISPASASTPSHHYAYNFPPANTYVDAHAHPYVEPVHPYADPTTHPYQQPHPPTSYHESWSAAAAMQQRNSTDRRTPSLASTNSGTYVPPALDLSTYGGGAMDAMPTNFGGGYDGGNGGGGQGQQGYPTHGGHNGYHY
ncbi:hypothetical protein DRE_01022 [Drechslerella stenobrocha 248]|uniref:Peptidase A1 domain-containing protein n=1 Tax=Drechslerella stenobrocha 248 TaxID=1043628 RepID=W7HYF6_9PEZI|nr:hypothetical protein DRE_01022 [Drechslerella stenobrocha 248]